MGQCEPRNFLQPCLLLLLRERSDHGYDLVNRLRVLHAVDGDAGAVYRALRGLEKAGMVRSSWQTSEAGPARRTYQVTPLGVATLDRQASILEETHHTLHLFRDRYRVLTGQVGADQVDQVGDGQVGNGQVGDGPTGDGRVGDEYPGDGCASTGYPRDGYAANGRSGTGQLGNGYLGNGYGGNGDAGGEPRDDPGDRLAVATGDRRRRDDHGWAHGWPASRADDRAHGDPGGAGVRPGPLPRQRSGG